MVRPSRPVKGNPVPRRSPSKHMASRPAAARLFGLVAAMLVLGGCSSGSSPKPAPPPPSRARPHLRRSPRRHRRRPPPPLVEVLPEAFESPDFIVTVAKPGDTSESLATRYLGSPAKAWMIEEYVGARSFAPGDEVVIPRLEWNPPGVYPSGYQLVPVLVYHNIGAQRKGRLLIAASTFEEQMRYLKAEGYRAIRLEDFLAHLLQKRQLPKKSVMVTFDDGHKGFLQYAHPLLKELGFPAVLFIQSDQIAQRPNASVAVVARAARAGEGQRRGAASLEDARRPAPRLRGIRVGLCATNAGGARISPRVVPGAAPAARQGCRGYRLSLRRVGRGAAAVRQAVWV